MKNFLKMIIYNIEMYAQLHIAHVNIFKKSNPYSTILKATEQGIQMG